MTALARNLHLLESGRRLLDSLSGELYCRPAPHLSLSAAGVHLRHALEFYECFLTGLPAGEVDYDRRARELSLESDVAAATQRLDSVRSRLSDLSDDVLTQSLRVRQDDVGDAASMASASTPLRELQFLAGHLVHHYAIMATILRHHGVEVPADFGVAPSTLDHWNEARAR